MTEDNYLVLLGMQDGGFFSMDADSKVNTKLGYFLFHFNGLKNFNKNYDGDYVL